jgi:predicted RNA binding protein YcfA (HicA-like mRNA interferase family)
MVPSLPRKELIRKFKELGFGGPYSGGKHQFMVKGNLKIRIPNPHGSNIGLGLIREILRQAGISPEDWEKT